MKILFEENELEFNELVNPLFTEKKISVSIARFDKIHHVVSGNKLFKLHYFLEEALKHDHRSILTFGGAYSNHLVATAYACKQTGIRSIGIVRGERPPILSHTLKQCEQNEMELHFISRAAYSNKDPVEFITQLKKKFGDCIIIPEGGYHPLGALGAGSIMNKLKAGNATHICTAIGTATTAAGLLMNTFANETIIGVPVLKQMNDIEERISFLCGNKHFSDLVIFDNYHFGGYAKKTNELIQFMNDLFSQYKVPTDFVYTAKMMYAVIDKIKTGYFAEGSNIICLHTGGLQGNDSLPASTLVF
jgi:1-aminocyclopropane-1-carboxylate deaminase/D-cysteine desulfhydrase-like pyridoxal-dependent ACC family enzyme